MILSDSDRTQLESMNVDDVMISEAGQVLKIIDCYHDMDDREIMAVVILSCRIFAVCANDASTIIQHSVLGPIPACQRCVKVTA